MKDAILIISKIFGYTTAGITVYDTHKRGRDRAITLPIENNTKVMSDLYLSNRRNCGKSSLGNQMQKAYIRKRLLTDIFENIDTVIGYISGGLAQLRDSIIPVSLSAMAIAGKNIVSKIGGIGLALYGLNYAASYILRLIKPNTHD